MCAVLFTFFAPLSLLYSSEAPFLSFKKELKELEEGRSSAVADPMRE